MAEQYFAVAKAYMLYRQRHSEDREVRDHLDFLIQYCQAENAATGSKYDANANIEKKNLATLIGELPKKNFIRLNRRILTDRMKKMYGKEMPDKYIKLLKNHHIYKNDETSLANYSFYIGATNDNINELLKADFNRICGVKLFLGSSTGNMLVNENETLNRIFSEVDAIIAIPPFITKVAGA